MAAAALARCGNVAALEQIRGQVAAAEPETRKIAAWILARLGTANDIPALTRLRDAETDPVTRAYQDHALAALGDASGREGLRKKSGGGQRRSPDLRDRVGRSCSAWRLRDRLDPEPRGSFSGRSYSGRAVVARPQPTASGEPPGTLRTTSIRRPRQHPRYSEGAVAVLDDGRLLYATTEFLGSGSDFAQAQIVGRTSRDGGQTWGAARVLQENYRETQCHERLARPSRASPTRRNIRS